jgi:signal transduction histidine kinase
MAHRQGLRLEQLVGDLLDVSRISSGLVMETREDVDLAGIVREAVSRFEPVLRKSGSSVAVVTSGDTRGRFDSSRIEQVVANLVGNAIRYGAGRPIAVEVDGRGEALRLVVRDQGIGIAPADKERIFGRFERAVSSQLHGGLGLGLWICQRIVVGHGGSISVDSEPGRGSTFTVVLPR